MKNQLAYCGLSCEKCPIHLATLETDEVRKRIMREEIARECNEHYGMSLSPEDVIDCDGCRANTGRLFSGCMTCEIRKCASGRGFENCAYCEDYTCEKLEDIFKLDPGARENLEKIRKWTER